MPHPSLADTRIVDAAGHALAVAGVAGADVLLNWSGGTVLTVPIAMLEAQDDGTLLLPLAMHGSAGEAQVRIPVLEEQLRVEKQVVDGDGVRISKRVSEREEQVALSLRGEELQVERVAIGVEVREGELPSMREEGDTVVIPVLEEKLVVRKQIVLKEELRITRKRSERTETLSAILRNEEVDVVRVRHDAGPQSQ